MSEEKKTFLQLPILTELADNDLIPVWEDATGLTKAVTRTTLEESLSIPDSGPNLEEIALGLGLGGTSEDRGVSREIWIAVGTPGDDAIGDARNPFRVETSAQFDRLMRSQAADHLDEDGKTLPLHVFLLPGRFPSRGEWHYTYGEGFPADYPGTPVYPDVETELGWLVYDDWIIEGSGIGVTEIYLDEWPIYPGPAFQPSGIWPNGHAVIAGALGNIGHSSHRAQVRNLTVNGDVNAITERPMGVKLDAVHLFGKDTRIDKVHVEQAYGKNFTTQTGVSTIVGDPGVVSAPAHGIGTNDSIIFYKLLTAVAISNPAEVTSVGHGRITGEVLSISGVTNVTPNINTSHTITVINANTFSLDGVNVTATGAVGGSATWTSAAFYTDRIDANTFSIHNPATGAITAFTHAGSGLSIQWGGGQGECFALAIFDVAAVGLPGYPNPVTDITGAVIQDCIVEDFGTGSNYELAMVIYAGATGNGIIMGNVVRRAPGVSNFTNAFGVIGVGSRILNNRAENCGALCHFDTGKVSGVLIAHNILINGFNVGISITPGFAGAVFDNITITGNYFLMDTLTRPSYALHFNFSGVGGTSLDNVVIRDNIFRHTGHTAPGAYATGLVLVNVTGLTVVANVIESTFDQTLTGNTNVVIRDNHDETGAIPEGLNETGNATTYLFADLPPAPQQGDTAIVTNLTAPTYLGVAAGGGAVVGRVLFNGTAWVTC